MSVRIRLSRIGKKHAPFYRIVSVDKRKKRDGAFLDDLGTYDPIKGLIVSFNEEGYNRRLAQGAIPSDAVKKIYMVFRSGQKGNAVKNVAIKEARVAEPQSEVTESNQ